MTEIIPATYGRCLWCDKPLVIGRRRGSAKRFCCPAHRHEFQTAARRWATMLFEAGMITADTLKAAQRSARAFCEGIR